ncbi:MAG: cytochrome c [Crocinitomicaceae bacterium]|nr:cytochrome c [Crocinitomicaceae bacterium]
MAIQRSIRWKLVLRLFFISIVLVGCGESSTSDSLEAGEHLSGEDFFIQRCTVCHGNDGAAQTSNANDLSVSSMNTMEIQSIIENGKNGMPPFSPYIESDSTMTELIEFVKDLRK